MSKATIIASASVLTSPEPRAAKPGPIGIKVPIKPRVGPNLVTISIFSRLLAAFNSSFSINFLAKASLDSGPIFGVDAIFIRTSLLLLGSSLSLTALIISSDVPGFDIFIISSSTFSELNLILLECSEISPPKLIIAYIRKAKRPTITGMRRL